MLRLFKKVANDLEEFDLLEGSLNIPLTQAQTDPTNPTKITTEYSKSVKLPLTPKNLQLMNYYTELDSVITQMGVTETFKPTVAMPVVVVNDNDIIFEGKLKLDKVNDYKGNRNMECTLYGKMNDYFNQLLNTSYWWDSVESTVVGYDNNNEPIIVNTPVNTSGMYVLPNLLDEGYNICKETVLESWRTLPLGTSTSSPFHVATLNPTRNTSEYIPASSQSHSIIAWAPTEQGYYANFEKDKVIIGGWRKEGDTYYPQICYGGYQDGTLVDVFGTTEELRYITIDEHKKGIADVIKGEGFSERQWCQYRSYYQKPTVYVNQIWKQYQDLSESITGMPLELDEDWFNSQNRRYTDLVYTLPDLQQEKKSESGGDSQIAISWTAPTIDCHDYAFGTNGGGSATVSLSGSSNISNGHVIVPPENTGYCNFKINLGIWIRRRGGLSNSSEYALCNGDGTASAISLQVAFRNVNDSNEVHTYNFRIVDEDNTSWTASTVDEQITMGTKSWNPDPQTIYFNLEGQVLIGQNNTNANKEYEMIMSVYCYNGNIDGGPGQALFQTRGRIQNDNALCASCGDNPTFTFTSNQSSISISREYRSNFKLTMKDLFPANYSPFNILLQYTKLFNLVWHYDQLRNKVIVMTREKWFSMYMDNILDWTDKIDKSREFFFKPLAWDKKYITFNYDDFDMDWLKAFKERYGITYGTKRITTQYNFNQETEELMCTNDSDKINPSLQVSMSRFPMSCVNSATPSPMKYTETFIGNRKDNKAANIWGQFFFKNGVQNWDSDGGKNNVYTDTTGTSQVDPAFRNFGINLVDDTEFQIRRKIFAPDMTIYASSSARRLQVPTNTRPIFSVFDKTGNYSCQFSKPAMTFYDNDAPEMQKTMNLLWWSYNLGPADQFAQDVYTTRWSKIIEEQYNEQNKLITCYVKLDDTDYRSLTCNRFVQIGNVLYTIYKVDDFQLGVGGLTKVTLLQVWNMNKYLGEYYVEPEPAPEPTPVNPYEEYFYVENDGDDSSYIYLSKNNNDAPGLTVDISWDKNSWSSYPITGYTSFPLPARTKLYFRCASTGWSNGANNYVKFSFSTFESVIKVGGNLLSLLYGDQFNSQTDFPNNATSYTFANLFNNNQYISLDASELVMPISATPDHCYYQMFKGCALLAHAPSSLPAVTLSEYCYYSMFEGCTSLVDTPSIPATTFADFCCYNMFKDCTSITATPTIHATTLGVCCCEGMFKGCTSLVSVSSILPATTLANSCYAGMFNGCTSLTTAPILPATTMNHSCYASMFRGTSLTTAPALPATTLAESCYSGMFLQCTSLVNPPVLQATTLAQNCYGAMFEECTSLVNAPALPANTLADSCYQAMFAYCTLLTTAPDLPATTLVNGCYAQMFSDCTSLNFIRCLATSGINQASSPDRTVSTYRWVYNISASGTFHKESGVTWPEGVNGIPSGWAVLDGD